MNETLLLPSRSDISWGMRYLLFQLIFLGSLISFAAVLLGIPLSPMGLNITYFAVNLIACIWLLRRFLCQSFRIGLRRFWRSLLWALICFAVYWAAMWLLGVLITNIAPDFSNVNDQNLAAMGQENFPLMVIGTVLLVPTAEECLYRGVVFGGLYRRSRLAAYLTSMTVFSLVHISGYIGAAQPLVLLLCFLQYLPAGFFLALSFERTGSLLAPILIHTAINAVGMMTMR